MNVSSIRIDQVLQRLHSAAGAIGRAVSFMEVCGTHTVAAFRSGLHSLMPANVRLLSGPGCPVCVTSQGDIDQLIAAGSLPNVTLCTYGDMLRVTGANGSLEQARSRGADVRVVYSTLDAVRFAADNPQRQVVFAAVGFETTAPASAAAVLEAAHLNVKNFTVLVSHKLIIPAMDALLSSGLVKVDGFLLPGHVSIIIGADAYRPAVKQYGLSCVIAGFEDQHIAAGLARLTEMARDGVRQLENQYYPAVTDAGNRHAQQVISQVFEPGDVTWRGLGTIPGSGLVLRPQYAAFDAAQRFGLPVQEVPEPPGCRCGEVILGHCTPAECKLFGTACTPIRAIGPCMVSSEGTCQAWFKYKRTASANLQAAHVQRPPAQRPATAGQGVDA